MLEPRDVSRYQRELNAMLRRAGDEDPEGFATIAQLLYKAVDGLEQAVLDMRRRGYSWRQIAHALELPPSTVHRRWARPQPPGRILPDALRHVGPDTDLAPTVPDIEADGYAPDCRPCSWVGNNDCQATS